MCWPTRTNISPPWSAPREWVPKGNAGGNARSAECSPKGRPVWCCRDEGLTRFGSTGGARNCAVQWDLRELATGGGSCRPGPRASSAQGATTQRGRERPPSDPRQVPCRLTPEGRARPRSAHVRPTGMRAVMASLYGSAMPRTLTPAVFLPTRARRTRQRFDLHVVPRVGLIVARPGSGRMSLPSQSTRMRVGSNRGVLHFQRADTCSPCPGRHGIRPRCGGRDTGRDTGRDPGGVSSPFRLTSNDD
jgi:hypothetical protein